MLESPISIDKLRTGIPGLDDVLGGGLPRAGIFLVQGSPGVGKTTLALRFLLSGIEQGERGLYVALTETRRDVQLVARSHGWSLDGVDIWELNGAASRRHQAEQTMFYPAEVELEETTRPILEAIERLKPLRVVVDSLSEIRLLAREPLRYRRQLLSLKEFFTDHGCTVILIDTHPTDVNDGGGIIETLVGGRIVLEKSTPLYGTSRRRLAVDKLRGTAFREGYHDYRIVTGGFVVYPRLIAAEHAATFAQQTLSSGLDELDALLGGGLERGTSSLIIGSAGTGKSSLATQYAVAAAERGEKSVLYTFEETMQTWLTRTASLGFGVEPHLASGRIRVEHIDPAELSPGQLAHGARQAVENDGVTLVVIDSLNGYLQSVPGENYLLLHLHELLTYLSQRGATTLMNMAQHGLLGPTMVSPVDVSYLADTVLLLRYFEVAGEVRQAISVVKKRSGQHERTIREFRLSHGGIKVGKPLREFQGVLTGVPTYHGPGAVAGGEHEH